VATWRVYIALNGGAIRKVLSVSNPISVTVLRSVLWGAWVMQSCAIILREGFERKELRKPDE